MLKNIIIWIFITGKIIWEYDKFFSDQKFEKNLSDSYHFIIISLILIIVIYIYIYYNYLFPKTKMN